MNDEQKQRNSKPKKSKNFSLVDDYGVWFVNDR